MEQPRKDKKEQQENLKELLQEAYSIAILLEESLEAVKEEQNTLYTVKVLHRLLKEMQGLLDGLLEGGEEMF